MADISDVTAFLLASATSAVYPSGTSQPSIAACDIRLYEGWPVAAELDLDMAGQMMSATVPSVPVTRPGGSVVNVSIFPMLGSTPSQHQIQDDTFVIVPPSYGMAFAIAGDVITVTGQPTSGEYLTIIADRENVYSRSGANTAAILAALATDAQAQYPGASSTATTLTIPFGFALTVRQGAVGTLGKVTHREKQSIMISVWAPTQALRTLVAKTIDNVLKQQIRVSMPDTSQAIVCYNRTNVSDEKQVATIYRRDLIYDVEYATVWEFPGYVITSANVSIANFINSNTVPAIT